MLKIEKQNVMMNMKMKIQVEEIAIPVKLKFVEFV